MPASDPTSPPSTPTLSLVIPCYNEAANLPLLVDRCAVVFADRDDVEVVLVDNGSTDATPDVLPGLLAPHPFLRSVRVEPNQGYGGGILAGLRAARGRVLGWTHADLQTDPQDALIGLERFERADDPDLLFAKGRRFGRPVTDVVFTVGMAVFETALLRAPLWDINAQPTLFGRGFFERWSDPPTDFSLDLFAYYEATRQGLEVTRFPVYFGQRAHGVSRWNVDWTSRAKFIRRTVDYSLTMARARRGR
ncbi:MAG: glycosyltransferase family 2 protein [Alphaproteobacteria bacterium]|nr:glycosyltransferase family 2 protein [Alphaproteobacteria bacterium]